MYPNLKRQKGLGLVVAIFLVVIMSGIVLALANYTESSARAFGQDYSAQRAFYAAEGGIEIALHRLGNRGDACSGTVVDIDFEDSSVTDNAGLQRCSVAVTCDEVTVDSIETWRINALGSCGFGFEQAQRRISVQARQL